MYHLGAHVDRVAVNPFNFSYENTFVRMYVIFHRKNGGGTLGMVPLIINTRYTLYIYSGYLFGVYPLKGSLGGG